MFDNFFRSLTKSSSAAGHTRHQFGNTSTVIKCAFQHSAKSSSPAGRTQRRLGNTSTVFECRNTHLMTVLVFPSRRPVRPAADDDFAEC